MSILTFPLQKTVFLMSDNGLGIYTSAMGTVSFVGTVPWDDSAFEKTVSDIVIKKCGGKPIVILNDMVEQHYRKERVLKKGVSLLDRQSMIKSKLRFAFPNYPIRASQKQNPGKKNTKDGKNDSSEVYLFTALPEGEAFQKTLKAAELSYAQIDGIGLLPIESAPMVRMLEKKLAGKSRDESSWVVFMGQHQSGALRQIVIKDNHIALTRISPVVESYDNPEAWAQNVAQEFKGTMSYVARFGYDERDPLSVIAIANVAAGQTLKEQIDGRFRYQSVDVGQASKLLGLKTNGIDSLHYADTLHAAWITKKPGLVLPMASDKANTIAAPRKAAKFYMMAMILLLCFLLYTFVNSFITFDNLNKSIKSKQTILAAEKSKYDAEIARQKELGLDTNTMSAVLALSDGIADTDADYLKIIQILGQALGTTMRFDRVLLEPYQPDVTNAVLNPNNTQNADFAYQAKLQITYPNTANVNRANRELEDLRRRIAQLLPEHAVELTKKLKDTAFVDEIVVQTGAEQQEKPDAEEQDFIAEIIMAGPAI